MISIWIMALLTLLCVANMFLLFVLAYSSKRKINKATKLGFGFMGTVLVLNMLFSIGGIVLW